MSESKLPEYPLQAPLPHEDLLLRLLNAVDSQPLQKLVQTREEIEAKLGQLPQCEYESDWGGGRCGRAAVTVCVGIPCCLNHARQRAEYFGIRVQANEPQ